MNKILPLDELKQRLDSHNYCLKLAGGIPCVVLCHGCFDVLTIGHVRHLQAARKLGWLLVVTVTPDRFVNKGAGRPVYSEQDRAEMLAALECVDFVAVNQWESAVETIKLLRPDVYCKGGEYKAGPIGGPLLLEWKALSLHGGKLEFTDTPERHTTEVLAALEQQDAIIHYAPYGIMEDGMYRCGAPKGKSTGLPGNTTCLECKKLCPGLWPEYATLSRAEIG